MTGIVMGNKTFFVLPPEAADSLQPSTVPQHTNTSTVPISVTRIFSEADSEGEMIPPHTLERFRAQLIKAFALPGACQVMLTAGESILVPQGWWHSAEGIDGPGIGVGAWFR